MSSTAKAIALVLATFTIPSVGRACSQVFLTYQAGPNFQVRVEGEAGAVPGLALQVTAPDSGRSWEATTNSKGIAAFEHLPPGQYSLQAGVDAQGSKNLEVFPDRPAGDVIDLQWPSSPLIHVRSASGTFREPRPIRGHLEQPTLSLDLREGVSGRVLASVTTSDGTFDFGALAKGLYFLEVKRNETGVQVWSGLISLAVDPHAPDDPAALNLFVENTSCGWQYMDGSKCQLPPLRAAVDGPCPEFQ